MIGTSDGMAFEDQAHMNLDPHMRAASNQGTSEDSDIKNIYVIRHGATALNSEDGGDDKIRGWKDVPLSRKGKEEAEDLAHSLKDSGIQVIHHSDLSRATHTAEAIAKTTGAEIVSNPKLRPWNVGDLTGTSSKLAHPQLMKYICEKPDEKIPGGESFNEFKERTFEGVNEALLHAGNKRLALATHHRVERLLNGWQDEGQPEDHSVNVDAFDKHGEPPGSAQIMPIKLAKE